MRIVSGTTDQYAYFKAVAVGDGFTPVTGLVLANFVVYRSRNGGVAAIMTTAPATLIAELSAANMPGWYSLLMNEDMSVAAGNITEEMLFSITHSGGTIVGAEVKIELFVPGTGLPAAFSATAGAVSKGTQTGVYTSTINADGVFWQGTPAPPVDAEGLGLAMELTFQLLTSKASSVHIHGREDMVGVAHVWAWNYFAAVPAFERISDTGGAISGNTNTSYVYTLLSQHQSVGGAVMIRVTSDTILTNKSLWLDQVYVTGVGAGSTANEIAQSVASHDIHRHTDHNSLGFRVSLSCIDEYGISAVASLSQFTCPGLPAVSNRYQYHLVRIHAISIGKDVYMDSWISSMTAAGVVTLGRALPLLPTVGDELYVCWGVLSPDEISCIGGPGILDTSGPIVG